jgi:hypothetical protein
MVPGNKRAVDRMKIGAWKSKSVDVYGNLAKRGRTFESGSYTKFIKGSSQKKSAPPKIKTPPKKSAPPKKGSAKPKSGDWRLYKDWQGVKGNNNFFNTSKNLYGAWNRVGIKRGDSRPISRSDPLHTGTINVPNWNKSKRASQQRPRWR